MPKTPLAEIQSINDWVKIWEGGWSFLTCSRFGDQYTKELKFGRISFNTQSIIFSSKGRSSAWMRQQDKDNLGKFLATSVLKKPSQALQIAKSLKDESQSFLKFMATNQGKACEYAVYEEFWHRVTAYYQPHISVKYIVDYLEPKLLKKYLPKLEEARLASEPVFKHTEDFLIAFFKLVSKQTKVSQKLLMCMTDGEVKKFFTKKTLPKATVLQARYDKSVIISNKNNQFILAGTKVAVVEKMIAPKISEKEVKGSIAYGGKALGIARIVGDPTKAKTFNKGDILITGMTRPEFLSLMHKASAFVTDAGGILSHAAIVARELKKPCVIGTMHATKVFKDGDMVEVDANKGIVKKI